jgi:hypothetical protein
LRYLLFSALITAALIISSCSQGTVRKSDSGKPYKAVPQLILDDSISVGFGLNSIVAQASMKAIDKEEDFTLRCSAQILADRPDKLLIVATKGLGTEIMNLSLVGDSLDVWLPRKKTLYQGKINDLNDADLNFHPQEIVEQVLFPTREFLKLPWQNVFEDDENVLLQANEKNIGRHLLTINKNKRIMTRRQLFDKNDKCIIDVSFSKYRQFKEIANKYYPRKFHLHFPEEGKDLYIVLRTIDFNEKLSGNDFQLNLPDKDKIKIKPLKKSDSRSRHPEMLDALKTSGE